MPRRRGSSPPPLGFPDLESNTPALNREPRILTVVPMSRSDPVKAELKVDLEVLVVESGRPFRGTAVVTPREDFDAEGVNAMVIVTEVWLVDVWETDPQGRPRAALKHRAEPLFSDSVQVSPATRFIAGEPRSFRFEVFAPVFHPSRMGGEVLYEVAVQVLVNGRPGVSKRVSTAVIPTAATPLP